MNNVEKFTGYFRDSETGLDYADQRYHNPGMGRFTSRAVESECKLLVRCGLR
jgi:RHS repeat-associated protein